MQWTRRWVHFPERGSYPHNIWAREGLSGAGYFAHGFASLLPQQQAAMRWFYQTYFQEIDQTLRAPFDSVSVYPHLTVAFINWPFDIDPVNPVEICPRYTLMMSQDF